MLFSLISEELEEIVESTFCIGVFSPTITTAGFGSDDFLVSVIILEASFLRLSICFCVVSTILDSTIASNILTPLT